MRITMKRIGNILLSGILTASILSGCATSNPTPSSDTTSADASATTDNQEKPIIKVVLKTLSSEYWNYVAKGCQVAGEDLDVQVDVLGATSETAYDEQMQMIETILSSNDCDAMVIAPLQADTVANQIADIAMPVIAIDTNIPSEKVQSFVGFDNEEMASMGGKSAVEEAKKKGWTDIKAIGIAGVQGDSTSEARMSGYQKGIEEAGGTYLTQETQYADGVSDKAVAAMEAVIQNHPEGIAIVVANNDDMAMGAARAAVGFPAYENTIFMGCGGNEAALDAILGGKETMTVAVDGYDVGYRGVEAAVNALHDKAIDKFIASPAAIVTLENAEAQKQEVEKKSQ